MPFRHGLAKSGRCLAIMYTMQQISDHIQIATANYRGRTVFSYEYRYYEKKYSWEAKAFIAHCISQWSDRFEHVLDCWDKGKTIVELDAVDYWGPRFVERFGKEFPQCDADWYRDILRAKLRSLILPKSLIDEYFEMVDYREFVFEEGAEKYFKRFNAYFGSDIKPLPADWLSIGREGGCNSLKLSNDILRLAKNMDIKKIVKIVSWVLSGFTKNFDIFYADSKRNIKININLCKTLARNYPEYFGKGNLSAEWFKEIYKAKFLSIRIPERLLKPLFANYTED